MYDVATKIDEPGSGLVARPRFSHSTLERGRSMSRQIRAQEFAKQSEFHAIEIPTESRFENLIGQTFGRYHVAWYGGRGNGTQDGHYWICLCKCGTVKRVKGVSLKNGHQSGCGCWHRIHKHKSSDHVALFGIRRHMLDRCYNNRNPAYSRYGGRGITVCARWRESWDSFFEDVTPRPDGMSLDRIDNDKGYWCGKCEECKRLDQPKNWRWADGFTQLNNYSGNRPLTINGKTLNIGQWGKSTGIDHNTISDRIKRGWKPEDAIRVPVDPRRQKPRLLTYKGETYCLAEWARRLNVSQFMLYARLQKDWSVERALSTPHVKDRTHCKNGHERSAANTYYHKASGKSHCKICSRIAQKAYDRKRKKRAARWLV